MSKAVLISIRPKWCQLIAIREKTVEIRKTRPKLETPLRVYIYATKAAKYEPFSLCVQKSYDSACGKAYRYSGGGEVIGEFICDNIVNPFQDSGFWVHDNIVNESCISPDEIRTYANGRKLYAWHISNLKIYTKALPLSMFYKKCRGLNDEGLCWECGKAVGEEHDCAVNGRLHITRPPQSWCYVEELEE